MSEDERRLRELQDLPEITILQLIYQQKAYEGHAKDHEFSATSMREHCRADTRTPSARCATKSGCRCRPRATAAWCMTCTARPTNRL